MIGLDPSTTAISFGQTSADSLNAGSRLGSQRGSHQGSMIGMEKTTQKKRRNARKVLCFVRYDNIRDVLLNMRLLKRWNCFVEADPRGVRRELIVTLRRLNISENTCPLWVWRRVLLKMEKLLLSRNEIHVLLCLTPVISGHLGVTAGTGGAFGGGVRAGGRRASSDSIGDSGGAGVSMVSKGYSDRDPFLVDVRKAVRHKMTVILEQLKITTFALSCDMTTLTTLVLQVV